MEGREGGFRNDENLAGKSLSGIIFFLLNIGKAVENLKLFDW